MTRNVFFSGDESGLGFDYDCGFGDGDDCALCYDLDVDRGLDCGSHSDLAADDGDAVGRGLSLGCRCDSDFVLDVLTNCGAADCGYDVPNWGLESVVGVRVPHELQSFRWSGA
ncbi:hypothetical protein PINS_up003056 [Pythium insidiosum]|nr:hypothetical protein PINS_up003056 [Pythium insidiosum]